MQGEFLQQVKGLAEYLRAENKDREEKLKEQKINVSAQRIAQAFEELGPEADPKALRKLTFDLIEDAAGLNALRENIPLISSLYDDSLKYLDKVKTAKEAEVFRTSAQNLGYLDNAPGNLSMGVLQDLYSLEKGQERTRTVEQEEETITYVYGPKNEVKSKDVIGPSKKAEQREEDKRWEHRTQRSAAIQYYYSKKLAEDKAELKALNKEFNINELGRRYSIAQQDELVKQKKTIDAADSWFALLQGKNQTKDILDDILESKKDRDKYTNNLERYNALTKTDREKLYIELKKLDNDKDVSDMQYQNLYSNLRKNIEGQQVIYNESVTDKEEVIERMKYVGKVIDYGLSPDDLELAYNTVIDDLQNKPTEIQKILKELPVTNSFSDKSAASNLRWIEWFNNLSSTDKLEIYVKLKNMRKSQ